MDTLWNKQVKFQFRSSKGVAEWQLFGTNKSNFNSEVPKELWNRHSLEQSVIFSIECNHINYIVTDRTYCTFTLLIQLPKGDKK